MILQSLVNYYESLVHDDDEGRIPRYGFASVNVSFAVELSAEGEFLSLTPTLVETTDAKGKTSSRPTPMIVPKPYVRASGVCANYLCDNAAYFFGFDTKGNIKRALESRLASAARHRAVLKDATGVTARAVLAFFERYDPNAPHPELDVYTKELSSGANLVFSVCGVFAHRDEECMRLWTQYLNKTANEQNLQCLVTGQQAPVAILHDKVKGVRDANTIGASLVGFNARSFESYGKDEGQGLNAPVSEYAAYAYVTALNHLIRQPNHRQFLGDMTVLYWAENGDEEAADWLSLALNGSEEDDDQKLDGYMKAIAHGEPVSATLDLQESFCVLGLAPNAARLSVRFFYRNAFGTVVNHVVEHYKRIELTHAPFERERLSPYWLLASTVNPNANDKKASPPMAGAFLRSVLTGTNYPESLHQAVHTRLRAERDPTYPRVSLIKAYLLQNKGLKEEITVALNPEWTDIPYVLGRLFCMLESVQQSASPDLNTTIKDRYFTSACSTPAPVFAQLLKLKEHHLRKLDTPHQIYYQREIGKLLDMLPAATFPKQLTLPEQDKFILGYYHQRQANFTKKTKEEPDHE